MTALLRTKRIVWAFGLFLATLVLTFSYVSGRRYLNALRWVEHTQTVVHGVETVLAGVRELESGGRGYVITGDAAFLEARELTERRVVGRLAQLASLVRDNPEQLARVERLTRVVGEKRAFITENVELRRSGQRADVEQRIGSRRGKLAMDEVQRVASELELEEQRLLEQRSSAAARTQHETIGAIGAGAVVMIVLLAMSFLGLMRDAREVREAASELAESEARYRTLVENVSDLVVIHGPEGELRYVSPSVEALLGLTPAEAHALSVSSLLHPEDLASVRYSIQKFQSGEVQTGVVTCRLRRRDGEYRWFELRVTRVNGEDGRLRHYQSAGRDITVRRQLEQRLAVQADELRNLSLRDGLTGLYNRRGFLELSAQVVRVAEREKHRLAVLFVDLDGLKTINDELGHGSGDRAIGEAADLLRSTCRATDVVARLGGDEFVVLASNLDGDSVNILRGRLDRALAQLNRQPGRAYQLSFSLGIASFDPAAPVAIEALLIEADSRMYQVKAGRKVLRSRPSAALSGLA
jgi:diguanylate cyclase (GGDEF)-like protein/PAS domain S-box-containing protein